MFSNFSRQTPDTESPEQGSLDLSAVPVTPEPMPMNEPQPQPSVQLVEQVSAILSPYFIVIVGLLLSDSNFLIGMILVFIGVFSLLKLSWQDIRKIIDQISAFFQEKE